MYRSKPLIEFTKKRRPIISGRGQVVHHHVKMLRGGGMSVKPPDSHIVPIADEIHHQLDSPGNSERSVFMRAGLSEEDVKAIIIENLCAYLESLNIDSAKLIIDLLTNEMQERGI